MIYRVSAGENNRIVIADVDTLLTEILGSNTFYMDKLAEVNFEAVLLRKIRVGRLVGLRFWLSDQYTFDLGVCILRCCQFFT